MNLILASMMHYSDCGLTFLIWFCLVYFKNHFRDLNPSMQVTMHSSNLEFLHHAVVNAFKVAINFQTLHPL